MPRYPFPFLIVSPFVGGLFLLAASTRPWLTLWVFLAHVSGRIGAVLAFALTVVATLLTSLRTALPLVPKALDNRLVRHLTLLAVLAVLGRATPLGGWAVLFLAAVLPWSGPARKRYPADTEHPQPSDEATFAGLLGTLSETEIRQKATQFRDQLREPALTSCQRQAIWRRRNLCYHVLDERRRHHRAPHPITPSTNAS